MSDEPNLLTRSLIAEAEAEDATELARLRAIEASAAYLLAAWVKYATDSPPMYEAITALRRTIETESHRGTIRERFRDRAPHATTDALAGVRHTERDISFRARRIMEDFSRLMTDIDGLAQLVDESVAHTQDAKTQIAAAVAAVTEADAQTANANATAAQASINAASDKLEGLSAKLRAASTSLGAASTPASVTPVTDPNDAAPPATDGNAASGTPASSAPTA